MADLSGGAPCRTCGGLVDRRPGRRGGRPRQHCHGCRPHRVVGAAAPGRRDDQPCLGCGGPVDHSASRRGGRRRLRCHSCRPPAVRRTRDAPRLACRVEGLAATSALRAGIVRVFATAEIGGWSALALERVLDGPHTVFDGRPDGQPVQLSAVHAALGASTGVRVARDAHVVEELGLLVDDVVPTMRSWIEQRCAAIPAGFRTEVRAWLLVLLDGDQRSRPRSPSTLYAYFGQVRPHLITWSATRAQLREITEDDIREVLDPLRGHRLAGAFVALRSLFRFARRRRLIFADPTRRLHIGRVVPARVLLPMTEDEIAAVARVVVTPAQRLVVALVAVHAARAGRSAS